jgi:aminopeptidase N
LLDESATENQMLGRAALIAHETAHMWFGDLVTMRWFNDVWMKEVFASFMADKIVDPLFPKVNHELRFFLAHYPGAYAVDRTEGSHPIRQQLENLNEAGSLYGAIIYQKAPIVMRQLEHMLGADSLRDGVREHLKQFEFGNATWIDLVKSLREHTDIDLLEWSLVWVEEAGRPAIRTERDEPGGIAFVQSDPQPGRSLRWAQRMEVSFGTVKETRTIPLEFRDEQVWMPKRELFAPIDFILPSGGGLAYGDFILDASTRAFLLKNLPRLEDPLTRGAAWVTLWEELLGRRVPPSEFLDLALAALPAEDAEQNVELLLGYMREVFWRFIDQDHRRKLGAHVEQTLRNGFGRSSATTLKSAYFSAFRSTVTTSDGVAFLERVWRRQERIAGVQLSESDEATIALELVVRLGAGAGSILDEQRRRFTNPDRKARFEFVMPALSHSEKVRDLFFLSLSDVKNRRREPWVLEGLRYLGHPLRAPEPEKYIRPALELLREIQRTGDIFFPKNWVDAVLSGHNTRAAADAVRTFLAEQKTYPVRLRRIILQSADSLFRASEIISSHSH